MVTPSLRIGDTQRRAVDSRLQAAVGDGILTLTEYDERSRETWGARTQADLDAVVADLPPAAMTASAAGAPAAGVPGRLGRPRPRWAVAVLGEHNTIGPVAARQRTHALSVLGRTTVDLRRTDLPAVVHVSATAVLGTTVVLVPVGVRVEANGMSLLGSREEHIAGAVAGAPTIRVRALGVLGSVEIGHGADGRVPAAVVPVRPGRRAARSGSRAVVTPGRRRPPLVRALVAGALVVGVAAGGSALLLERTDQASVFGSGSTDVSGATVDTTVRVGVLFGIEKVVVADDAQVDLSGVVVFGSTVIRQGPVGSGPVVHVHVHASGGFGSVQVIRKSDSAATGD